MIRMIGEFLFGIAFVIAVGYVMACIAIAGMNTSFDDEEEDKR